MIRFLLDGLEVTGVVPDDAYLRPWYLFGPGVAPESFANPHGNNLKAAILRAQEMRQIRDVEVWLSTDPEIPVAGWPIELPDL